MLLLFSYTYKFILFHVLYSGKNVSVNNCQMQKSIEQFCQQKSELWCAAATSLYGLLWWEPQWECSTPQASSNGHISGLSSFGEVVHQNTTVLKPQTSNAMNEICKQRSGYCWINTRLQTADLYLKSAQTFKMARKF